MDYAWFIRLRRPAWDDFEAALEGARRNPRSLSHADLEELALRFRQILHDLALARARYPRTGVSRRLQRLSLEGTRWLTRSEAPARGGLGAFLTRTFPRSFQDHLGPISVAIGLFALTVLVGLLMAAARPGLATAILGPESVEGLAQGRLWTESLVTTVPPAVSSSQIATNNMSVALFAWAGGALAGLGSLWVVALNGLLLGSVVGVTQQYSMAGELLEFISAHGPLEVFLLLVAAGAGLGLARSLITAGDRPRAAVLQAGGRSSLALLLGCLPWFLVLAAVEAWISPSPALPAAGKVLIGVALVALFLTLALRPAGGRSGGEIDA